MGQPLLVLLIDMGAETVSETFYLGFMRADKEVICP